RASLPRSPASPEGLTPSVARRVIPGLPLCGLVPKASPALPDHCSSRLREAPSSHPQQGLYPALSPSGSPGRPWADIQKISEEMIMRTLVSALLALSVLTGVAASANAFDAKSFYQDQDRQSGN